MSKEASEPWLEALNEEDRSFIRRFLLVSGSLKDLAKAYGISYPTVRLRLDRLIEKIRVHEATQDLSPFERTARALYADGKVSAEALKTLLDAHRREQGEPPQTP